MAANPHVRLLLTQLQTLRLTRIVDVGANPANVPPYAGLLRMGGCEVIGFEPAPEAFAALALKTAPNEHYVNAAVGDGRRKAFKVYQDESFSSVFDPDAAAMNWLGSPHWAEVKHAVEMKTVKLDLVPEARDFDLLKIDIQGGELAVFRGGRKALATAVAVITELRYFPLYAAEPMMGDQDLELRKQGFQLHKLTRSHLRCLPSSQRHRLNRQTTKDQMIDGDAVYLRSLVGASTLPDEKLKHLCLLASAVFDSHSLVLNLLDELVRRVVVPDDLPQRYLEALPARFRRGS